MCLIFEKSSVVQASFCILSSWRKDVTIYFGVSNEGISHVNVVAIRTGLYVTGIADQYI